MADGAFRRLYAALGAGDIPALVECIDADVIVDEPAPLPYGGVHHGRDAFLHTVLGGMTSYAKIQLDKFDIFEGESGAVGKLHGTLTAHSTGETFDLTMIEVHDIAAGKTRGMDIYVKNPADLAEFFARSVVLPTE